MNRGAYAEIWKLPGVRQAVVLGALGKAPWFGAGFVLTLHVVEGLGESYARAGLVTAVFTIAVALASPLRGRLLDRIGLRRTLAPSLVVLPLGFLAAPLLDYGMLLVAVGVIGLFAVPWFVVTRQVLLAAVPRDSRRAAISLDSVVSELAFIVGPTAAILLASIWPPVTVLVGFALLSVFAAAYLTLRNPRLVADSSAPPAPGEVAAPASGPREINRGALAAVFITTVAAAFCLGGTDLSIIAVARSMDSSTWLAVFIAAWGAGSLVGGLVYGMLAPGTLRLRHLLLGLAGTTMLAALGITWWVYAALMFAAGLFVAPTLAAITERIGDIVPDHRRGEAFGWQGTFMTGGNAMAPPTVGAIIDGYGWQAGLLVTGGTGLTLAGIGWLALQAGRRGAAHLRERRA